MVIHSAATEAEYQEEQDEASRTGNASQGRERNDIVYYWTVIIIHHRQ